MNYTNETNCLSSVPVDSKPAPMSAIMDETTAILSEAEGVLGKLWMHLTGESVPPPGAEEPKCMMDAAAMTANKARAVLSAAVAISERIGV